MENTAPKWLLWAGIALILWNLSGVGIFISEMMMTPADMAKLPKDQQMLWAQMPPWGWAAFGISTISGVLAAIGIAMKKKWAMPLAVISVIGVIGNFTPTFVLSKGVDVWQPQFYAFPLFIFAIALVQLWLTRKANAAGWAS